MKNNIPLKAYVKKKIISMADVVSVESMDIKNKLECLLGHQDILYIPDGVNLCNEIDDCKKEKMILAVGRLGTEQKATEVLIRAYECCKYNQEWKLYLVGSLEDEFVKFLGDELEKYPDLREQIVVYGEEADRKKLFGLYARASIFVMPSRWESFGIALAEAQSKGCYVVTTDQVPAAYDMIPNDIYGKIIESDNDILMARCLDDVISQKLYVNTEVIKKFAEEKYNWISICREIDAAIKAKMESMNRGT